MSTLDAKILLYANTTANLTANNPLVETGRVIFETDTGKFKIGNNATYANTTYHPHDAADITSGTLATARLGSGTANASTVLSGNQTWVELPARKRAVTVFISGKPADGELLWRDVVTNATSFTVVANSTECVANAGTAATGAPSIDVLKNGTSVGNITWSANATSGTVAISSNVTFASGDVRSLVANATADATLANISITLAGSA